MNYRRPFLAFGIFTIACCTAATLSLSLWNSVRQSLICVPHVVAWPLRSSSSSTTTSAPQHRPRQRSRFHNRFEANHDVHLLIVIPLQVSRSPTAAIRARLFRTKSTMTQRFVATGMDNRSYTHEKRVHSIPSSSLSSSSLSSPTLYDILGATPTATRAELKQRYVALARLTHPDAQITKPTTAAAADVDTKGSSTTANSDSIPPPLRDFTEIAAAWNTLSDAKQRKRYDRSLQAEQFSATVTRMASDFVENAAAPAAKQMILETLPFLRRTTATTLATLQVAAQELKSSVSAVAAASAVSSTSTTIDSSQSISKKTQTTSVEKLSHSPITEDDLKAFSVLSDESSTQASPTLVASVARASATRMAHDLHINGVSGNDKSESTDLPLRTINLSRSMQAAWQAGQRAARYVDSIELEEKAALMIQKAQEEMNRADQVNQLLQNITAHKLYYLLHVDGSPLTSVDALCILQQMNETITSGTSLQQDKSSSNVKQPALDKLSMWDHVLMKQTVMDEIKALQQVEATFMLLQRMNTELQMDYQSAVQSRLSVKAQLNAALHAEEQARMAYEAATRQVNVQRWSLENATRTLADREASSRLASSNVQRQARFLHKQQEKVRSNLRDKEKQVVAVCARRSLRVNNRIDANVDFNGVNNDDIDDDTCIPTPSTSLVMSGTAPIFSMDEDNVSEPNFSDDQHLALMSELEWLQLRERQLQDKKDQIQNGVEELLSQALAIQAKAQEMTKPYKNVATAIHDASVPLSP
jgi:hypothetical protein